MGFEATSEGRRLADALHRRVDERVNRLVEDLVRRVWDGRLLPEEVGEIVAMLREAGRFDQVVAVVDAALASGGTDRDVAIDYCQALIELGARHAAEAELERLLASDDTDDRCRSESLGRLGRIAKDRFIAARRPEHLRTAVDAYRRGLALGVDPLWHGSNIVALLDAAQRSRVEVDRCPDDAELAGRMLDRARVEAGPWSLPVEVEMNLASGNGRGAEEALGRFVASGAPVFRIQSLRRQLVGLWELDAVDPLVLGLDDGQIGAGAGADVVVPTSAEALEQVFGAAKSLSYRHLAEGLDVARSVGKVVDRSGTGWGTAFLLPGAELDRRLGPEPVLVTSAHVVSSLPDGLLDPSEAHVAFDVTLDESGRPLVCDDLTEVWTSTVAKCDVTILRFGLGRPASHRSIVGAPALPTIAPGVYVTVIGHPGVDELSLSIRGNDLLEYDEPDRRRMQYLAPTLNGSSGSPVLDDRWRLIGVHHGGSARMPRLTDRSEIHAANEGITLSHIRRELAIGLSDSGTREGGDR